MLLLNNRFTNNKKMKIWHVINSQFQRGNYKGYCIQKDDFIRFGKIIYKVKYISTRPKQKSNKKNKSAKRDLNKILPSGIDDKPMVNNFDEENKMLHESIANNSALAVTIDQVDNSSRLGTPHLIRNKTRSRGAKINNLLEEDKSVSELDKYNYASNELDLSVE